MTARPAGPDRLDWGVVCAWEEFPVFAGLNQEALAFLRGKAQELHASAGEVLVREGDPGNQMFLIVEGRVVIAKHFGTPNQTDLAVMEAGNFFGEMCVLETLPRVATVVALSATHLLSLRSVAFYHFYQRLPAQYSILILNIARDLSRRLRSLDERFAARH